MENTPSDERFDTHYWNGTVDARLSHMEHRLDGIESTALRISSENSVKLDHLHACIERVSDSTDRKLNDIKVILDKRGKAINLMIGGLAIFYIILQIATPFLLKVAFR